MNSKLLSIWSQCVAIFICANDTPAVWSNPRYASGPSAHLRPKDAAPWTERRTATRSPNYSAR